MNSIADRHTKSATITQIDLMPGPALRSMGDPNKVFKRKIQRAFRFVDKDGSGDIDRHEFKEIMSMVKVKVKGLDIMAIFDFMDRQKRGVIELGDMEAFLKYSFSPRDLVRVEMSVHLRYPQRFQQYHSWHVKSRPFTFTLVPGFNNTEAHFAGSTDPKMCAAIKKDARLTYINMAYVAHSQFMDIQVTLKHSPCPLHLSFQNIDTIKRAKIMDSSGKFHKVTRSSNRKLSPRDLQMFNRPDVNVVNYALSKKHVKEFRYQYYNHCRHCPPEEAWYLRIHLYMEDENYNFVSKIITWFIMSLIAMSTVTYVAETLPKSESWWGWETIEEVVTIIFSVEFLIRILSCRNMLKYIRDPMNIIDICAVAPWWIEHFTLGLLDSELLRVVRVIRLLRLVRLLKASSMQETLSIFKQTVVTSFHWLCLFLLGALILLIVFASILFVFEEGIASLVLTCNELTSQSLCSTVGSTVYVNLGNSTSIVNCRSSCLERGDVGCCSFDQFSGSCLLYNTSYINQSSSAAHYAGTCSIREDHLRMDGTVSPFYEILNSFWCASVTMMMVGYGDYYPITESGRIVSACAGVAGLMCMALCLIVVGFHFIISLVDARYLRLPEWMNKHWDVHGKGAVRSLLKSVNRLCGLQLFKLQEELVLLSKNNQINTAKKLEQILSYNDGWSYLPFAYDDSPGLPRISQFKLFVLFGLFGKKYQMDRMAVRKAEKELSQGATKPKGKPNIVRSPSPFKFLEEDSSDTGKGGIMGVPLSPGGKKVDFTSIVSADFGDFSSPRKLKEFNIDDEPSQKSGAVREWSIELLSSLENDIRKIEDKNRNCNSPKEDPSAVFSVSNRSIKDSRSKRNSPAFTDILSSRRLWGSGRRLRQRSPSGVVYYL